MSLESTNIALQWENSPSLGSKYTNLAKEPPISMEKWLIGLLWKGRTMDEFGIELSPILTSFKLRSIIRRTWFSTAWVWGRSKCARVCVFRGWRGLAQKSCRNGPAFQQGVRIRPPFAKNCRKWKKRGRPYKRPYTQTQKKTEEESRLAIPLRKDSVIYTLSCFCGSQYPRCVWMCLGSGGRG